MSGPSPDYLALLRGEIDAEEYVRRLKRDVRPLNRMTRVGAAHPYGMKPKFWRRYLKLSRSEPPAGAVPGETQR